MTKGYWGIDIRECPEIVDDNGNILLLYVYIFAFVCTVASNKFWSSMSFQNLVRLSQI
jgi:hypothetical protein